MNEIKRIFIGIDLPEELSRRASGWLTELRARVADELKHSAPSGKKHKPLIRWVPPENFHFTLKFLGSVTPDRLQAVVESLRALVASASPFEVRIGELGAFPTPSRARVLWIGARSEELTRFAGQVERATHALGFPPEDRPYSGHVTLARIKDPADARPWLEKPLSDGPELGRFTVKELVVFESKTTPEGSQYFHLEHIALGA